MTTPPAPAAASEVAFTPGPWRMSQRLPRMVESERAVPIAQVIVVNSDHATGAANARLIASCPTMFEYIRQRAAGGCVEAALIVEAVNARG